MRVSGKAALRGFTLIEVIVTILIVAVVGAMMYSVLGTSMTGSSLPVVRLQTSLALQRTMENMMADFRKNFAGDVAGLKNAIGTEGANQNNAYGQYDVVHNRFIKFTGQSEDAWASGDPQDILKVTIKNGNNETLTAIFVQ